MKISQLILFLILMLIYILFRNVEKLSIKKFRFDPKTNIIIVSIIFSITLILILSILKKNNIIDPFIFEVTPSKLCDGGPYMWSSNPQLQKFCSSLSPEELKSTSCTTGYIGRPVNYEYTPESDANWKNTRCDDKPSYNIPVL